MTFGFLATERQQKHVSQRAMAQRALIFMSQSKPFRGFEVKVKFANEKNRAIRWF